MQARLLLGPAGSGKTFRCLAEIRAALNAELEGPPLLFIAPKQATFQLERQLLSDPGIAGYTRLRIVSFERLGFFIFQQLGVAPPKLLSAEGRVMVLRGILAEKRDQLKLFRASARLNGFAQQLSLALRELQQQQLTPESLLELAAREGVPEGLAAKLQDLAMLLRGYLDWLRDRGLEDSERLLELAVETLRAPRRPLEFGSVWVDGFAEFSKQELNLLEQIAGAARKTTIALCLDQPVEAKVSWLSQWSVVRRTYSQCREQLGRVPGGSVETEILPRRADVGRFAGAPELQHLERHWAEPKLFALKPDEASATPALRIVTCANPEAEVTLAAREILRFVRAGGRFRDLTIIARTLENYHALVATIFARYEIPFFLDRREVASHHPLAELTRNTIRTLANGWQRDDWFAALKTGLLSTNEDDIDHLENEALARGWSGADWHQPVSLPEDRPLEQQLEPLRRRLVAPFDHLALALARFGGKPNGGQLAEALRGFWEELNVEQTLRRWSEDSFAPEPVHLTVWTQMSEWLENLELAFGDRAMSLRDWLPIIEAGLAGLTVGVIPPVLDQVLVGAIDRSRNPDVRRVIVVGMNEGVFPAMPESPVVLTESDRLELEQRGVPLMNPRQQLGRERFLAYIACTRAREEVLLTCSSADNDGNPLNPSSFLGHLQRMFPALGVETALDYADWREAEHANELAAPLLRSRSDAGLARQLEPLLLDNPAVTALWEGLSHLVDPPADERLSPALAAQLHGPALRTSVSRMEQFAACPFRFFVHSGLRAEERRLFELDIRNQGSFQHDVLAGFHEQLKADNKGWRDITPAEARERIKGVAVALALKFRDGLLQADEESRFTARVLTESLQDFVEVLVGWMQQQYAFEPAAVELPFGDDEGAFPPWKIELGDGHELLLNGRIDRIDLWRDGASQALCVVVDYKSSQKQLDAVLLANGIQLQLPAYLNVLRHWPNPDKWFGVSRLIPAGVFYVNLRGKYERGGNRDEALGGSAEARKAAYQHAGRFDAGQLRKLDTRIDARRGDQFRYALNRDGSVSRTSRDALDTGEFMQLLDGVEENLLKMGRAVYAGEASIDPYQKGTAVACDQCDYWAICRIDRWTHVYRTLRAADEAGE